MCKKISKRKIVKDLRHLFSIWVFSIRSFPVKPFQIRLFVTFSLVGILLIFAFFGKLSDSLINSLSTLFTSDAGIKAILGSSVFLFSNLILSSWRFHNISKKFGIHLSFWENHKINIYSLLYSMFFDSFFGADCW